MYRIAVGAECTQVSFGIWQVGIFCCVELVDEDQGIVAECGEAQNVKDHNSNCR
jgi:hypothetical protein